MFTCSCITDFITLNERMLLHPVIYKKKLSFTKRIYISMHGHFSFLLQKIQKLPIIYLIWRISLFDIQATSILGNFPKKPKGTKLKTLVCVELVRSSRRSWVNIFASKFILLSSYHSRTSTWCQRIELTDITILCFLNTTLMHGIYLSHGYMLLQFEVKL